MTLDDILQHMRTVNEVAHQKWSVPDQEKWVLARVTKLNEEVGEFSEAILSQMGFQRPSKLASYTKQHLEDEWADAVGMLFLLGLDLDVDMKAALDRKLERTLQRFQEGEKNS